MFEKDRSVAIVEEERRKKDVIAKRLGECFGIKGRETVERDDRDQRTQEVITKKGSRVRDGIASKLPDKVEKRHLLLVIDDEGIGVVAVKHEITRTQRR